MTGIVWIVLVDEAAVSYCTYENYRYLPGPSRPMALATLEAAVGRARATGSSLQFVLGNEPLPAEHRAVMAQAPHVKILPLGSRHDVEDGVFVVGREDYGRLPEIEEGSRCTLNLRIERDVVPELAALVETALVRSARVNVMLLNLELWGEEDLLDYRAQLQRLAAFLEERYRQRDLVECNLFAGGAASARRDCGAGITHLTLAPDGRFYVCPGFFYDGLGPPCGDLEAGVRVPLARLYTREGAPLCSSCTAVTCPRCVYLNKKITAEVNTPSQQQCVVAHLEQEASARLAERLRAGRPGTGPGRPRLDYRALDPFVPFLERHPGQADDEAPEPGPAPWLVQPEHPTRRSSS
jgi:CXXX repeat peptide maturase